MREFNTSCQNILDSHYTLLRPQMMEKGLNIVKKEKYFTISAPRQRGKSTYFVLLAATLKKQGYKVAMMNFGNYRVASLKDFLSRLTWKINEFWGLEFENPTIANVFQAIEKINDQKWVLIIDEVEGINKEYFKRLPSCHS